MRALAFSGGKDSLACWFLCKPAMVIYVNTGKSYPETRAMVNLVSSQCERFIEVYTDRDAQNYAEGLPSDLVPIDCTTLGQLIGGTKPVKVQSYLGCCYANISKPLVDAAKQYGVTHLIRGQRLDEAHKSPARDGEVVDGIVYEQPIERWSAAEVLAYLKEQMGVLPDHYALEHSSMDCYDCTAFAAHSHDRAAYMRERHPDLYGEYRQRLGELYGAIAGPMNHYRQLMGA